MKRDRAKKEVKWEKWKSLAKTIEKLQNWNRMRQNFSERAQRVWMR